MATIHSRFSKETKNSLIDRQILSQARNSTLEKNIKYFYFSKFLGFQNFKVCKAEVEVQQWTILKVDKMTHFSLLCYNKEALNQDQHCV